MFRQHCVIIRQLAFITFPNYINTITAVVKLIKFYFINFNKACSLMMTQ
jgi:hypothetical protein